MFQLILPFQLDLPLEQPSSARPPEGGLRLAASAGEGALRREPTGGPSRRVRHSHGATDALQTLGMASVAVAVASPQGTTALAADVPFGAAKRRKRKIRAVPHE